MGSTASGSPPDSTALPRNVNPAVPAASATMVFPPPWRMVNPSTVTSGALARSVQSMRPVASSTAARGSVERSVRGFAMSTTSR